MINGIDWKRELKTACLMIFAAVVSVCSLHIFVVPANFAPSGIDGVSTILFEITGINMGWFKLLFNLPLMILAWIFLKKRYVVYVILFIIMDAVGVIVLERIGFFTFVPLGLTEAEQVGYRLISAVFSGIGLGISSGIMLKIGSSGGGVDILACLVNLKRPDLNVERIISVICYVIIASSWFVYRDLTSILLSVIQVFAFEYTAEFILRDDRYAVEAKIITKEPEKICSELIHKYQRGATVVKAQNAASDADAYMVFTLLRRKSISDFMNTMKQYPEAAVVFTDRVKVQSNCMEVTQ